jgi:hypothetical protein
MEFSVATPFGPGFVGTVDEKSRYFSLCQRSMKAQER